jgi:hypothetical protein
LLELLDDDTVPDFMPFGVGDGAAYTLVYIDPRIGAAALRDHPEIVKRILILLRSEQPGIRLQGVQWLYYMSQRLGAEIKVVTPLENAIPLLQGLVDDDHPEPHGYPDEHGDGWAIGQYARETLELIRAGCGRD